MRDEATTECRTPAEGKSGVVRIPAWKYRAVRAAILEVVRAAGPDGAPFKGLADKVRAAMRPEDLARLGSVSWHVTTVKLNMEVEGEIARVAGATPQRLILS